MPNVQRRLNLLVFILLVAVGATGCARHGIVTVETSNSVARGVLIGDMTPVREGTLETIRLADVSSGVIDWGIGYGKLGAGDSAMGETMFINGHPVRSGGAPGADARFVGPFAVGIAPDQKPAARYRSAPAMKSASVADLLSDLASTYEKPVLVAGRVHFDRLETGAGLDGQTPAQSFRNAEALFVAIVARNEDVLNQTSRRVFHIPEGMAGLVDDLMLSSAAVLNNPAREWRGSGTPVWERIQTVVSVNPATSRISSVEADVYLINSLTQP